MPHTVAVWTPVPACLVIGTVSPYRREAFRLLAERERGGDRVGGAGPPSGALRCIAPPRRAPCGPGGLGSLPGRDLPAWRPRRASRQLPGRPSPPRALCALGRHLGPPPHRRPRAFGAAHPAPLPPRGRRGHLRRAREPPRGSSPRGHAAACSWRPRPSTSPISARRWRRRGSPRAAKWAGGEDTDCSCSIVGRLEREKGLRACSRHGARRTWGPRRATRPGGLGAAREQVERAGGGIRALGYVAASDLPPSTRRRMSLVLPSVRTATFTEPWGLVVNEAMFQGTPVITSDAVGAAAGGLVRDGRNGLVFPAGDTVALRRFHRGARRRPRAERAPRGRRPRGRGEADSGGVGRGCGSRPRPRRDRPKGQSC